MSFKKWRSRILEKKIFGPNLGKMGPNLPKFEVFGHFLEFESLDLSDFAYYDRQAWYLAGTGGPMAEKKFQAQIWAI